MISRSIQQEDITFINLYASKISGIKYVSQILMNLKEKMENNTILVGNFNTPLISINRSFRQNIIKETLALNGT